MKQEEDESVDKKLDAKSIGKAKDSYAHAVSFRTPALKQKIKSEDDDLFKLPKFQRLVPEDLCLLEPESIGSIVKELDIRVT